VCPAAQPDGHDAPGLFDELVPGIAAVIDDIALGVEDAIGQPIVADELPDGLRWSPLLGQFGGFAKLGSGSSQAANLAVSVPPASIVA
jgi:hypothetical protein